MAEARIELFVDATRARQQYEQVVREISQRPVNVPLDVAGRGAAAGLGPPPTLEGIIAARGDRLASLQRQLAGAVSSPEAYHRVSNTLRAEQTAQEQVAAKAEFQQQQRQYQAALRQREIGDRYAGRVGNVRFQAALAEATTPEARVGLLEARLGTLTPDTIEHATAQLALSKERAAQQKAAGKGGGLFGGVGALLNNYIGPTAVGFAAFDLGNSLRQQRQAGYAAEGADDGLAFNTARQRAIEATGSGFLGSTVDLIVGTVAPNSDVAARTQRFEAANRLIQSNRQIFGLESEVLQGQVSRRGFDTGGLAGYRRASIQAAGASRGLEIQRQIGDLEEAQERSLDELKATKDTATGDRILGERFRRIRTIEALRGSKGNAEQQTAFDLRVLDEQERLERIGVQLQTATFRDVASGASDREVQRRALNRRQGQEIAQTVLQNPRNAGIVGERIIAERSAFEAAAERQDRIANYANASAERQARARSANDPLGGTVRGILDAGAGDLSRANPGEREAINRRVLAEVGATVADAYRGFAASQLSIGTGQSVTAALLNRDPLTAQLEGIRGNVNAQVQAAESLPFGVRQATQGGLRFLGRQQQALARQRYGDQLLESRAGLGFGNESLSITANGEGSAAELARRAQANGFVRQAQLESLRAANAGRGDLIPQLYERGRLQIENQRRQYVQGFQAEEVNLGRVASTGNAAKVLEDFGKAAERLKNVPTTAEIRDIVDKAVKDLDGVR